MQIVWNRDHVRAVHEDHQDLTGKYPGNRILRTTMWPNWVQGEDGFRPGQLAESQSAQFLAETGLEFVEGTWRVSIERIRRDAIDRVNAAAGAARLRFVTDSPFQGTEYDLTYEEAQAFKAAGYTGDVPPMVQAEADAQGITASEATDFIIATAEGWRLAAAAIKSVRRTAIVAIGAGATEQAIDTLADDAVAALAAIQPE